MSSSTASALRQPQNLAELLDGRPDTREMISANLNLAHACLLLKQGEPEEVERALALAQHSPSTGLATISRCIRAEVLRVTGRASDAWDMAEELASENRFDTVAALYLRFLFPFRPAAPSQHEPELAVPAPEAESAPSGWTDEPVHASPSPAPAPAAADPDSAHSLAGASDSAAASIVNPDSEASISLGEDEPPRDANLAESHGDLPGVLGKIAQDPAVRLMRLRNPAGEVSEVVRGFPNHGAIEPAIVERPAQILAALGFGGLHHASFESTEGAAHSWTRGGRSLILVVEGATSAPALAARCTRAMEEGT